MARKTAQDFISSSEEEEISQSSSFDESEQEEEHTLGDDIITDAEDSDDGSSLSGEACDDQTDDDDDENSSEEEDRHAWGRSKKTFYAGGEEDGENEEEEEALRLQAENAAALDERDFIDDDSFGSIIASKKEKNINLSSTSNIEVLEAIPKNLSNLSQSQKEQLLAKTMPEFKEVINDLKMKMKEVKESFEPIMKIFKNTSSLDAFPSLSHCKDGLSFLGVKYQLLLSYCANLTFYLNLKLNGCSVANHPVINHLIKIRVMMEKSRPIEAKLKYQIDRLIRVALHGEMNDDIAEIENSAVKNLEAQHQRLRANPDRLVVEENEEGEEPESNTDYENGEESIYKPPRVAPVYFDDEKASKKDKHSKLDLLSNKKAAQTRILEDLQEEFSDKPLQIEQRRKLKNARSQHAEHVDNYEEENFTRLQLSKKELNAAKAAEKNASLVDELQELNDFFGDTTDKKKRSGKSELDELRREKREKKRSALDKALSVVGKKLKQQQQNKNYQSADAEDLFNDFSAAGNHDDNYEDEAEEMLSSAKASKKEKREKSSKTKEPVSFADPTNDLGEGEKRKATYNILKNRGLTPHRSKENRNPRVKQRMRFGRAQKKIHTVRPVVRSSGKPEGYSGEKSGIRTNITKSVRFNNNK